MAGNDRLDEPFVNLEGDPEFIPALRAGGEADLLGVVDDRRGRAVMRLVSLAGTSVLPLAFGALRDIGLHPVGRRGCAALQGVDLRVEVHYRVTQEFVLVFASTILGLVLPPLIGGEGDGSHEPALAHVNEGRRSRI
jgi:hypothetical protein